VRTADDFERIFAALSKQRPDGLYVLPGGTLVFANQRRIIGLALKSRLPSMYGNREAVDAGGLMATLTFQKTVAVLRAVLRRVGK
jgi:hypothetical protein